MGATKVPSFAGVCSNEEAVRTGLSVDENVMLLKRYNYIKTKLYDLMVMHMNSTPEWEVKGGFSLNIWLDAEHVSMIRKRISEMRQPPLHLDKVPDSKLEEFMAEAIHAQTTVELLTGIYEVIRPSLLKAYKMHLQRTNPLIDHPTCRMLKQLMIEEEEMIEWGTQALKALASTEEARKSQQIWHAHLKSFLKHANGVTGNEQSRNYVLPDKRAVKPFKPSFVPKRDSRFQDIFNNVLSADEVYLDAGLSAKERVWALLYKRLREMDVPEMQCSIVAETKGKPWEYYRDMGRQIWDEARHSMMGEAAFNHNNINWWEIPIRVSFSYELNTLLTPLERHAILFDIEFGLMPADKGKKYEWEIAKDSGYRFAALIHDYDWADEVLHAQIGKRWIVEELGGVEKTLSVAKQAYEKLEKTRPSYISEDPDWWEHFYREVKAREFPA